MFLLDYIRQRWQPRGSVVSAGVPPQERPAAIVLPPDLIGRHLCACDDLPHDAASQAAIAEAISDPAAIQHGSREIARRLIAADRVAAELEALTRLIGVLLSELARHMYISAARERPGAIGIRLMEEPGISDPAVAQLLEQDAYGLGPGVYPFDHVPANPTPGKRCGFYIRVVTTP